MYDPMDRGGGLQHGRPGGRQGLLHVDEHGVIDFADARAISILGGRSEHVIGRAAQALGTGSDGGFARAIASGNADSAWRLQREDGSWHALHVVASPAIDGCGVARGMLCAIAEVAEGATQAIEPRELRELYDEAPCGYHSLDDAGLVVQINNTELRWLGYRRDEVVGVMPFDALLAPPSKALFQRNFERLKAHGAMGDFEYAMRRKDGTAFPVLLRTTALTAADGRFLRSRASVFDITKEKWAAEEVRRYAESLHAASHRLVELQEAERRSLAGALHDLVGQKLTALSINLNIVKAQVPAAVAWAIDARLSDSLKLVAETAECIRDVMSELRPAVLDDYGLTPVLRWYADVFTRRTGVASRLLTEGPERRLPPAVEEALFRIAQEALANIAKHAHAHCVRLALRTLGDETILAIADDGCGFAPGDSHRPAHDHGWGLTLMRERAAAVGAEVDVASRAGEGTTVSVRWRGGRR